MTLQDTRTNTEGRDKKMDGRFLAGLAAGVTAGVIGMGIVIIGIIGIFFFAIMGSLIGAITGLMLQHVPILGGMVVSGFGHFGIESADLAQIGAMLGFVAGFFRQVLQDKR